MWLWDQIEKMQFFGAFFRIKRIRMVYYICYGILYYILLDNIKTHFCIAKEDTTIGNACFLFHRKKRRKKKQKQKLSGWFSPKQLLLQLYNTERVSILFFGKSECLGEFLLEQRHVQKRKDNNRRQKIFL